VAVLWLGRRRVPHVRDLGARLDENLRELIDPILNQTVTRPRHRRCAMRNVIDHNPNRSRTARREHSSDCCRRGDLSGEALHKNCPNCRRLKTVGKTTDGFSFQTRSTGHVR
jgi:hypothetical protein